MMLRSDLLDVLFLLNVKMLLFFMTPGVVVMLQAEFTANHWSH